MSLQSHIDMFELSADRAIAFDDLAHEACKGEASKSKPYTSQPRDSEWGIDRVPPKQLPWSSVQAEWLKQHRHRTRIGATWQ